MDKKILKINFYPKTIIEAINHSTKDSFINIDQIKNYKYIIQINNEEYGLFDWDDIFTVEKKYPKSNKNYILLDLSYKDNILNLTYYDENKIIRTQNESKLSKSKFLYLLNSSYNLNKKILSNEKEDIQRIRQTFINDINKIIDFNFLLSLNRDLLIFKLSKNLYQLPWQIISYYLAKNNILTIFSAKYQSEINKNIFSILYDRAIDINKIFILKEKNFEINENIYFNKGINRILFENPSQFTEILGLSEIPVILAHGFRKKDFSSFKVSNYFFNPYTLNECEKIPQIIFLLCCMMNYSESDNNFLNQLLTKNAQLIFSTPYIIPLDYIERILLEIMNSDKIPLFEVLKNILSISQTISSLIRIII